MEQILKPELKDYPINEEFNPFLLSNVSSKLVSKNSELIILPDNSDKIRLQSTRFQLFYNNIDNESLLKFAESQYLKWVRQAEYLIFGEYNKVIGYTKYWGSLASKRGNSKYAQRVRKRFQPLQDLPDIKFFNHKDRGSHHKTRGLFITNTYDRRGLTIGEAMIKVGEDHNRFISAFKKKYGKISVLRVWEVQDGGYIHIHILAITENKEFEAFHYNGKWRIHEKDDIADLWSHGFSDVEALSSTKGGMTYIAKYLGKLHTIGAQVNEEELPEIEEASLSNLVSRASVRTLSMMWLFRKRAFSISGSLGDLIRDLHNSNLEPEKVPFDLLQLDLEGGAGSEYIKKVVLLGFWSGKMLKGSLYPKWYTQLSASQIRKLKRSSSWSDNRHLK